MYSTTHRHESIDEDGCVLGMSCAFALTLLAIASRPSCAPGSATRGGASAVRSICFACPPGRVSAAGTRCTACRGARYQPRFGRASCARCPPGKYGRASFAGNVDCLSCSAGSVLTGSTCVGCKRGRFSGTLFSVALACRLCPVGKYAAQSYNAQCLPCEAGRHSSEPGASACAFCAMGRHGVGGAAPCSKCAAGRFGSSEGLIASGCSGYCPAGKYSHRSGSVRCKLCPPGHFGSRAGETLPRCSGSCPAGRYSSAQGGARECSRCAKGQFAHAAATSCIDRQISLTAKGSKSETTPCTLMVFIAGACTGRFTTVAGKAPHGGCAWQGFCDRRPALLQELSRYRMWVIGPRLTPQKFWFVATSGAHDPSIVRSWATARSNRPAFMRILCNECVHGLPYPYTVGSGVHIPMPAPTDGSIGTSATTTIFAGSTTALQTTTVAPGSWIPWTRTASPSPAPTPRYLLPRAPVLTQAPSPALVPGKLVHHGSPKQQWSTTPFVAQSSRQVPLTRTSNFQRGPPHNHVSYPGNRGQLNFWHLAGLCLLLICAGFANAVTSKNTIYLTTTVGNIDENVGGEECTSLRKACTDNYSLETEFGDVGSAEPLPPHVSMLDVVH